MICHSRRCAFILCTTAKLTCEYTHWRCAVIFMCELCVCVWLYLYMHARFSSSHMIAAFYPSRSGVVGWCEHEWGGANVWIFLHICHTVRFISNISLHWITFNCQINLFETKAIICKAFSKYVQLFDSIYTSLMLMYKQHTTERVCILLFPAQEIVIAEENLTNRNFSKQ